MGVGQPALLHTKAQLTPVPRVLGQNSPADQEERLGAHQFQDPAPHIQSIWVQLTLILDICQTCHLSSRLGMGLPFP